MFLALDESLGAGYNTIGCLCFPAKLMPNLEAGFIVDRLRHRLWGEVKWNKLAEPCLEKYKDVVSRYLNNDAVTFHSWTYKKPTVQERRLYYDGIPASRVIYRQAYLLIRTVIWKCRNNGFTGKFYILADESGPMGQAEYRITQDLLVGDARIDPPADLEFCNTGSSTSCGAMQVSDLLTGAVMSHYDSHFSDQDAGRDFVTHLVSLNKEIPLNTSPRAFPKLGSYKLHHCLFKPKGV